MKPPVLSGEGVIVECRPLFSKANRETPWAYTVSVGYVGGAVPLRLAPDEASLFMQCQKFEKDATPVVYAARPETSFNGDTVYRITSIGPIADAKGGRAA